jgi:1,2-phenylacetyl-CoA epoxidase catalytic subunit
VPSPVILAPPKESFVSVSKDDLQRPPFYVGDIGSLDWKVPGAVETALDWAYDEGRNDLLGLYEKGKRQQWNASERIDWRQELHPENPMQIGDHTVPIFGSPVWEKLDPRKKVELRWHLQAWQISQFLHGEQGALVCASKVVQLVPYLDAKLYAATQVFDEARHVEVYGRLLREKFAMAYPITSPLKSLLENVFHDPRWDFTYLGMQVLIEGLALAAFQRIRNQAFNKLAATINAYVMQDEARHVAFGRLALKEYYPQISEAERAEREEFLVDACWLMRERLAPNDVWEAVGLPKKLCIEIADQSQLMREFRAVLFRRVVPTIKYIGLWGPKIQAAFDKMGVLAYADLDVDKMLAEDEHIGRNFIQMRFSGKSRKPSLVAAKPSRGPVQGVDTLPEGAPAPGPSPSRQA